MKERKSSLRNESSKTKGIGLWKRITAALLLPYLLIYKTLSSTFLPIFSLFCHIRAGIKEIMADYVHQEMTRKWILISLKLFVVIVIKEIFFSIVYFL